jgi:hypothetical protein
MPVNQKIKSSLLLVVVLGCGAFSHVNADEEGHPGITHESSLLRDVPELDSLEATMREQGLRWGKYMDPDGPNSFRERFAQQFYDSANSFQQISEYLQQPEPWLTYAKWSNEVFREYLLQTNYKTQGWRRTTLGMLYDLEHGGPTTVRELEMLRDRPAYSRIRESHDSGGAEFRSRAVALAVEANIHAERAGSTRVLEDGKPRLAVFVPWMGSHLYEWRTGDYRAPPKAGKPRFSAFMFGLTAHALIEFVEWEREQGRDPHAYWPGVYPIDYGQGTTPGVEKVDWPTITDAIADVAEWAVFEAHHDSSPDSKLWAPDRHGYASFYYETKNAGKRPATDLNLMIAHAYAWLWKETGDRRYRDWADQLFGAGALNSRRAAKNSGKHFNQQFRMAFDYLKWRAAGDQKWTVDP